MPGPHHAAIAYPTAEGILVFYSGNYQNEFGAPLYQVFLVQGDGLCWPHFCMGSGLTWRLLDRKWQVHEPETYHPKLHIYDDWGGKANWWLSSSDKPCQWSVLSSSWWSRDQCDSCCGWDMAYTGDYDPATLELVRFQQPPENLFLVKRTPYFPIDVRLLQSAKAAYVAQLQAKANYQRKASALLDDEEVVYVTGPGCARVGYEPYEVVAECDRFSA